MGGGAEENGASVANAMEHDLLEKLRSSSSKK